MNDPRNVTDEFKGREHEDIVAALDARGTGLEIAIENTLRDYNMGSIVRTANAFGVRTVHVIGRKQWNKRGAMMTDKYLTVQYHTSPAEFAAAMKDTGKRIIAIDNVPGAKQLMDFSFVSTDILVFGQEGPGLSEELLGYAADVVAIEQYGSTRSLNVAVAAGIAMYCWTHGPGK
jgi:tRNA G18 (ribose-2'-O)-methylase SpoU